MPTISRDICIIEHSGAEWVNVGEGRRIERSRIHDATHHTVFSRRFPDYPAVRSIRAVSREVR